MLIVYPLLHRVPSQSAVIFYAPSLLSSYLLISSYPLLDTCTIALHSQTRLFNTQHRLLDVRGPETYRILIHALSLKVSLYEDIHYFIQLYFTSLNFTAISGILFFMH